MSEPAGTPSSAKERSPSDVAEAELHPIVGVHQPNFFPWLGYFHKMRWSDTFVLLDDVQVPRRSGGSVTNRCELVVNGKRLFVTAPIDRTKSSTMRIDEARFSPQEDFRGRLTAILETAYAKAPYFKELGGTLREIVQNPTESLAAYNTAAITRIAEILGLRPRIVASSTLGVQTTSTQRLVDIVERLGGRTYLAGGGAKDYQDDTLFFARGINVYYREFVAPAYARWKGEPQAGLSVLDALLVLGPEGTRKLIDQPLDPGLLRLATEASRSSVTTTGGGT